MVDVISGLVSDLLGRLTNAAIQEYGLLRRLKDDLLTLKNDFNQIQAVLEDAEEKHTRKQAVELWLKSLRSAALKMGNLLDDISAEYLLRQLHKELGMKYRVRAFFSPDHNPLMFRTKMAHKVKTIKTQFNDITAQISKLNLIHRAVVNHVDGGIGGGIPNRETSSLIHSSTVFGRNEEMEKVTEKICSKDIAGKHDIDNIRVYAICGMGGLGKTTLAQLVYNHERVTQHFELKCWMYVSENFQVKELIRGIIESIDKHECRLSQLDEMQKYLQEQLRGKRFLVVLDDVWIEPDEKAKWDQLSQTLSCGEEGSIVVMTTRSKTTSRMMAKVPELQHEVGCLSEEDSWLLFKKFAFAEGREGGNITELEPIGKKIVEKCKGLPLAVKTLGGLMWSESSASDWQRVMESDIWELQESNILPALKLSYNNLPPHVKRCFAYCCMLPKGHEMGKDLLILLWKTNRLIPSRREADWYMLGEEIFNCLVWRSFFQVVGEEYKMHDLMHDLARYVMGHDCLIIEPGKELIVPDEVLHLSSSSPDFASLQHDLEKLKSLRSVFIFAEEYEGSVSHIFDQVYLRVLYLARIPVKTLPGSICKLKLLRYLNLSRSWIEVLPESIIYLQNLQVLLLNGCWKLVKLPEGMRYMRSLQYLNLSNSDIIVLPESIIYLQNLQVLLLNGCWKLVKLPEGMRYMRSLQYLGIDGAPLRHLPVGIGKLTSLRTLTYFRVPENDGAQIGELGSLNLIGPSLILGGLYNVRGGLRVALSADLKSKRNLLVLDLCWNLTHRTAHDDEDVLEGLEPNSSLEKLKISEYMGKNISPSWMVNLRSLVQIDIFKCKMCKHIPQLGKLPSLGVIKLTSMKSLKCLDDDDNILFPQLQELHIDSCHELIILPGNLPKLKVLDIYWCEKLVSLPGNLPKLEVLKLKICMGLVSLPDEIQSFKYLNNLEITYCENLRRRYAQDIGVDWPKISHIPHIHIY